MKQDALERAAISDATRDREAAIDLIEFCVEGLRADCMSEELRLYLAGWDFLKPNASPRRKAPDILPEY